MGAHYSGIVPLGLLLCCVSASAAEEYEVFSVGNDFGRAVSLQAPRTAIAPGEVAVLVNDSDPQSVEVGAYYAARHAIPAANVVHVDFPAGADAMGEADFDALKARIDARLPARIEALAVTWTRPWKVGAGMSMSSALALGYDARYVAQSVCSMTAGVSYYGSSSTRPWEDFGIRPAMVVAGTDAGSARAVIDRGVAARQTLPAGDGFLVRTTDASRSVRYADFQATARAWNRPDALRMSYVDDSKAAGADYLQDSGRVLFYLTGLARVPAVATNRYLPGALADHLTSAGGILFGGSQMTVLDWLAAGVTASYGTVTEPCNYTGKFPAASELVKNYFRGSTALEAYWKSVYAPGEGLFVGDPLARPFGTRAAFVNGVLEITTTSLEPGRSYALLAADSAAGPFFQLQSGISVAQPGFRTIRESSGPYALYRLTASAGATVAPPPPTVAPPPPTVAPPPPPTVAPPPPPPPVTAPPPRRQPAADRVAPSVSILSLDRRQGGRRHGNSVRTRVQDNVGVVRVELYVDGRLIGISRSIPFTVGFDSRVISGGRHQLVAWAYDAAENVGVSAPLAIEKPRGPRRGRGAGGSR